MSRPKGFVMPPEHRAKISAAHRGKVMSAEARTNMSLAKKGKTPWNKGVKITAENREKFCKKTGSIPWNKGLKTGPSITRGLKRRPMAEETKQKLRDGMVGRNLGPEHAANVAKSRTGAKHTLETVEKMRAINTGKRHRPETLEKLRKIARRGPDNHRWGKPPVSGKRFEYNGKIFRSSYEVRFAKSLDARGMKWQYEPTRFDLVTCTYRPDFLVPEMEAYVEVKGWLGPDSKRKIGLFREHFPEIPLIVMTEPVLKSFERRS